MFTSGECSAIFGNLGTFLLLLVLLPSFMCGSQGFSSLFVYGHIILVFHHIVGSCLLGRR